MNVTKCFLSILVYCLTVNVLAQDLTEIDATVSKSYPGEVKVWLMGESVLPLNRVHSWLLVIKDIKNEPVSGLTWDVAGGMEDHGHALPTSPIVSPSGSPGSYRIDGLKFQMTGEWFVQLTTMIDGQVKTVRWDFEVQP